MPWIGAAIGAGGSLLGGLMGSSSAEKAAKEQRRAAVRAQREQTRQFDITREDQAPWTQAGTGAVNRLSYLLGLENALPQARSLETIRSELASSGSFDGFEQGTPVDGSVDRNGNWRPQEGIGLGRTAYKFTDLPTNNFESDKLFSKATLYRYSDGTLGESPVKKVGGSNTAALDAEAQRIFAQQQQAARQAQSDPAFGSLTRNFTMADFNADPVAQLGFQTGLDQGTSAINKRAAAMGGFDSGATLKALTRFGNDFGNQKANESFNRFNINQSNLFNRLSGVAGSGQQAVNQVGVLGANTANNIGNIGMSAANARGAASIAQGNIWGQTANTIGNQLGGLFKNQNAPAGGAYTGTGYTNADVSGLQGYQGIF